MSSNRFLLNAQVLCYWLLYLLSISVQASDVVPKTEPNAIDQPPAWQTIDAGGDTQCSDGSAYQFHVKPGDKQKLFIFLNGGGACWNAQTCDPNSEKPFYVPRVDVAHNDPKQHSGIFNLAHPSNPVKEWTMVFVPYCTGDIHLGSTTRNYQSTAGHEFSLNHYGAINSQAVIDWVKHNITPQQVVVSGASAGALASPIVSGQIASLFPNAKVLSFADGATGYGSDKNGDLLSQWAAFAPLSTEKYANFKQEMKTFYSVYAIENKQHPQIQFGLFDTDEDHVQVMFRKALGDKAELIDAIDQTYRNIRHDISPFTYYLAKGQDHTILRYPRFYTTEQGGESFVDWFKKLIEGKIPSPVDCRGEDDRC